MQPADVIRMVETQVPFNHLVGSRAVEVDETHATWTLTQRPEISNHIETIHAGALWVLGEGTTGSIVAAGFPIEAYTMVLKSAECRYRRLATSATAYAQLDPTFRLQLLESLNRDNKADIPISVVIRNEHDEDAYFATYIWSLRRK